MQLQELVHPLPPGLLPAPDGVWFADDVDLCPVGGEQLGHRPLKARISDQRDGVAVSHAGQSKAEPESAARGLDDPGAGAQVTSGSGLFDHVETGTILDSAGVEALQLCPEAAIGCGKGFGDPEKRGIADQPGKGGAGGGWISEAVCGYIFRSRS